MSPATHMTGAPTPDWVLIAPALTLAAIGLFAATMFGILAWRHRNTHARLRVLAIEWGAEAAWFDALAEQNTADNRILTARAEVFRRCATDLAPLLEAACLLSTATAGPAASAGISTSSTTSHRRASVRPAPSATGPAPSPADAGDSKRRR